VCTPHDVATAKKWQVDADAEQQKYFKGRGTPGSGGMIIGEIKIRLRGAVVTLFLTSTINTSSSLFREGFYSPSCALYADPSQHLSSTLSFSFT
jgi:hypothetical protein